MKTFSLFTQAPAIRISDTASLLLGLRAAPVQMTRRVSGPVSPTTVPERWVEVYV
ncbi:hypothetical protein [Brevifollis gellanilyticus]|uniref:hypothetical protein n=1 Tax=Brevifollis gellanilyticus TaxID=748831 RepID=UPI001478B408|nr:hypothetical protein [Brevifollis gellanilyticus]